MIKQCEICSKDFKTYPSLIKIGKGKYCSRKCSDFTTNEKVIVKCRICSKEFTTNKDRIKDGRGKFCSRPCYEQDWNKRIPGWNKGQVNTWSIGNQYRKGIPNLYWKTHNKEKIGDKNHKWISDRSKLKGHNSQERRSSAYIIWRHEIHKRDNWTCRLKDDTCKGKIEVHHILSFTNYPNLRHDINNGITLCKKHHPRKRKDEDNMREVFQKIIVG